MSDGPAQDIHARMDAYLDGLMDQAEREAFGREIRQDTALGVQVESQALIDASLKRVFAPPASRSLPSDLTTGSFADAHRASRRRRLALSAPLAAAAVLAISMGAWRWWTAGETSHQGGLIYKTVGEVYRETLAGGFKPQFVCKNDREFATAFYQRLNQALLPNRPANVEWVGVSRGRVLTTRTHYILLRIGGREVIVFVDRLETDPAEPPSAGVGLYVHRRRLNQLVLYEVTASDKPEALDLFYEPDIPQEWKDEVPGWDNPPPTSKPSDP